MKNENSDISRPVADSECDAKEKPPQTKPCEGVECGVQWYMTDWSAVRFKTDSGYVYNFCLHHAFTSPCTGLSVLWVCVDVEFLSEGFLESFVFLSP